MKYVLIILLIISGCTDNKEQVIVTNEEDIQDICYKKIIHSSIDSYPQDIIEQFHFLKNAIDYNQLDIVKYGVENGFHVSYEYVGQTLLSITSRKGNTAIFDYLISQGANINLEYGSQEDIFSVLEFAVFDDHSDFIKKNFNKYSDTITNKQAIKKRMFWLATSYGATNTMLYLMEDVPLYDDLLFAAINAHDINVLTLLYDNGLTNINTTKFGNTLIEYIEDLSLINEQHNQEYQLIIEWVKSKSSS
ncbi:MAG: hypothetical protein ACRC0X_01860 [Brevinema sp.]